MKICSQCGTTNSESDKICKKCGQPLTFTMGHIASISRKRTINPKPSKSHKDRDTTKKNRNNISISEQNLNPIPISPIQKNPPRSQQFEKSYSQQSNNQKDFPLKSIPPSNDQNYVIPNPIQRMNPMIPRNNHYHTSTSQNNSPSPESEFDPRLKSPKKHIQKFQEQNSIKRQHIISEHEHQKSLTKSLDHDKFKMAMAEAVQSLKRNLDPMVKKSPNIKKKLSKEETEIRKELVPRSLNEILISLSEIDLNIEASALVNIDGSILASATSKRITESLISTIGNTFGTISQDIISSLGSGNLQFASLQGSQGFLFMALVMKNVFLILLTSTDSKSGVINIAKVRVKKQLELFYAKKNLQKLPI